MDQKKKEILKRNWNIIKKDHPLIIVGFILTLEGFFLVLTSKEDVLKMIMGWLVALTGFHFISQEWCDRNRNRLNAIDNRIDRLEKKLDVKPSIPSYKLLRGACNGKDK